VCWWGVEKAAKAKASTADANANQFLVNPDLLNT
jgi:hypothetical protein